ncbi:type VI secretion system tube protein Hcp [Loktanella sp. IMCC34160]|uniref:Hcp family type VI secretion system effector n=1 Tax=Rhodobacterales TaxID=204455 RepID=UPI00101C027C|nr:type VI secretion system tube protein Hcp [Loktanella sp. IMCC34160]RYG91401.1 type VI secretion system tube protein Hcp [Loktanella sp. IMCC34160]
MADNIVLKLGDEIKGESPIDGYEDWIQIHAWSWGATQSGTTHEGMGGGGGKVSVQDLNVTKFVDASTHDLIKHVCNGKHIPTAELIVMKAGGDAPVVYWKMVLTDLIITSYQTQGSQDGLDRISESISINFAKFEVTYTKQEMDGSAGPESTAGWDIQKNVAV